MIVVANKVDGDKRVVSQKEGEEWARRNKMLYHETSGRTGQGIDNCMMRLSGEIHKHFSRDRTFAGVRVAEHVKKLDEVEVKTKSCCSIL